MSWKDSGPVFWGVVFLLWLGFLSGGLSRFGGSPGILQAIRMKQLLVAKQERLKQLSEQVEKLRVEAQKLETDRNTQIREIRRVLGYTAPDEIIFDFRSP